MKRSVLETISDRFAFHALHFDVAIYHVLGVDVETEGRDADAVHRPSLNSDRVIRPRLREAKVMRSKFSLQS